MSWTRNIRRKELEHIRNFNLAAMSASGFAVDRGRSMTAEEIGKLNLTPPNMIRDSRAVGTYHWR